jgi:tetratricopeptide (TPR) repeat protein
MKTGRVCLSMIVRNESRIIERCLDAARPVIDAVTICDTGSTDQTVETIERWLARAGLPGRVLRHPFVDFAHNRTLAMQAAVETIRGLGWNLDRSYLLFLDADMVLGVGDAFRHDALTDDAYRVIQQNGALRYPNVRLARASLDARFVGATHEYFSAPDDATQSLLESVWIDDRNDGGSRADKYRRDLSLLEAELARDPHNLRAMFYLAQTYRGLGEFSKALIWYRKRAAADGWEEEAWYAQYAIGLMLEEAGDDRASRRAFATALRRDPQRPEPYFHLACLARSAGHNLWAARLALAGLALGVPANRSLFLNLETCHWGLLRELAIAGYYTTSRHAGADANERMALGVGAPPAIAAQALHNSAFYAEPLSFAAYSRIMPELPEGFSPCNPSILRTADGYLLNCRSVSYHLNDDQTYSPREADGIFRTRNFLLRLDRELRALEQTEVVSTAEPLRSEWVRGLEDARLFATSSGLGFTCTTTDLHPAGSVRMSLVTLSEAGGVAGHHPLHGHDDDRPQKNWLPFADGADSRELLAVYSYEPLVVLRVDQDTGSCEPTVERTQGRPFDLFRGSAGPIDLPAERGGGRLLLVHAVAFHEIRYYLHRFLRVDDEWRVTAASRPFYFQHLGIEFACGACIAHEGDLLVTFGVEDREAWLCRIPLERVCELLRPLPDWPQAPRKSEAVVEANAEKPV